MVQVASVQLVITGIHKTFARVVERMVSLHLPVVQHVSATAGFTGALPTDA